MYLQDTKITKIIVKFKAFIPLITMRNAAETG